MYANDAVALTPKKAFALKKPVQFVVNGQTLKDSNGHLIDGAHDGQAGSNYVTILQQTAVVVAPTSAPTPTPIIGY